MSARRGILRILRFSLWHEGACEADAADFEALQKHALAALAAPVLAEITMPDALRRTWEKAIYRQVSDNVHRQYVQDALPIRVPYAILKGTAAAQYYPHPEYRAQGDIDLMTRREDFEAACDSLLEAGYVENTLVPPNGVPRHRGFRRDHVEVEVHAYFAQLADPARARHLDELIIDAINPAHALPDPVNGLVILAHIGQHLEEGLGLRQIVDWMMFVHRCLSDEAWPAFKTQAEAVGLERLAVATTRMCELFLGLPHRDWCAGADRALCEKLMDYVLDSGNFGMTRARDSQKSEKILSAARSPRAMLALLQRYGRINWKASQRHPWLRPFAWLYQIVRYARKGLTREGAIDRLRAEARAVREKDALFDALGVGQRAKGFAVYRDGTYRKETRL